MNPKDAEQPLSGWSEDRIRDLASFNWDASRTVAGFRRRNPDADLAMARCLVQLEHTFKDRADCATAIADKRFPVTSNQE